MRFISTSLVDAYLIEPEPIVDERGFFARSYCQHEFASKGIHASPVQCNISYNRTRGTLRGMHFQRPPNAEAKLVHCISGAIYDVIIDLRQNSPSFMLWMGFELTADNHKMLYIPEGFAHGFQTLVDETTVFYQMFNFFSPNSAGGVRWNDPTFAIEWPLDGPIISDRDSNYPDFDGFSL